MGRHGAEDIESRFADYVDGLVSVIGHQDRAGPLRDYCVGLVMPGARKSVEVPDLIRDGGDHGACANGGPASVVAAFCR